MKCKLVCIQILIIIEIYSKDLAPKSESIPDIANLQNKIHMNIPWT